MTREGGSAEPSSMVARPPRGEWSAVASFLDAIAEGPQVLVLEGEAGIGKTTLWAAGVARAEQAGLQVATSREAESETSLSFAALGDLFQGVPERLLTRLPTPQRRALEVALLRREAEDTAQQPRAVALACASVLRLLSDEAPVLLAIDDLQWLDQPSARAISFVLRRLHDERVGVLLTRRTGEGMADPLFLEQAVTAERLQRVELGPLSVERTGELLRDRLGVPFSRPLVARIHATANGNPFYSLQIATEVARHGVPEPGEPLPVSADARDIVRQRLASLPAAATAALSVVALSARPTVDLVCRVLAGGEDLALAEVDQGLQAAAEEGLIAIRHGTIRFRHPLFAAGLVAAIAPAERREWHGRLAEAVTDPEQRARHLALSATTADPAIALALEEAAHRARRQGAASAATELAVLALEHTQAEDGDAAVRRRVLAATCAFDSGDAPQARELLESAIEATTQRAERSRLLSRLCEISWQDTRRVERYARQALAEAADDGSAAAAAHVNLAWVSLYRGDPASSTSHLDSAWALDGGRSDPGLHGDALVCRAITAFVLGRPYEADLAEAVALQGVVESSGPTATEVVYSAARVVRGLLALWQGELSLARDHLEAELRVYEERGRYVARDELLCYLAHATCRSGQWELALHYATECLEVGEDSGHLLGRGQNIMPRAWLRALRGDLDGARRDAGEGLELSEMYADLLAAANNHGVLGFVELSAGDPARSVPHLRKVVGFLRAAGSVRPGMVPFVPDAIEALVLTGRLVEAEEIHGDDRLMGRLGGDPGWTVVSAWTGALIRAGRGDLDAALELTDETPGGGPVLSTPYPFEHARLLLTRGELSRRAKRKAQAREDLSAALAAFEELGAPLWAARARAELARVSPVPAGSTLTPTETRLADLVVEGRTNREAASLLFISVKTVEANLSRVYRKLGVRSRAELVAHLLAAADQVETPESAGAADVLPIDRNGASQRGDRSRGFGSP